jgi:hypothetical protein
MFRVQCFEKRRYFILVFHIANPLMSIICH